jgi:hypothetical protein
MMKKVAGPRHCPLVTVDSVTKTICGNNQMKEELKRPRGLPWPPKPASLKGSDHRSPALQWSLFILIMELRKNGLEVGESIY